MALVISRAKHDSDVETVELEPQTAKPFVTSGVRCQGCGEFCLTGVTDVTRPAALAA